MMPRYYWILGGAVFCLASASADAQSPAQEARLRARLDASTYTVVAQTIDSARAAMLPVEPLVDKALEGAAKRVDGARVVSAVRALAGRLRAARTALGATAAPDEIAAGAAALQAGISPEALAALRTARPQRPLVVALVVVTDLAARGVQPDTAAAIVTLLASQTTDDATLLALRSAVQHDVGRGARPTAAAELRARGALMGAPTAVPMPRVPSVGAGAATIDATNAGARGTPAPPPRPRP